MFKRIGEYFKKEIQLTIDYYKSQKDKNEEYIPRGIDNPYDYYPECYAQDRDKSILTSDQRYDMTRFSTHEDKVIRDVIAQANKKYPSKYRGIGLANESHVVIYKPRYILFDVVVIAFGDSENPLDQIAVSFANIQRGAYYRKDAIRYFEAAIDRVPLSELDRFSSLSVLSMLVKISEAYEREKEFDKAIYWLKILIERKVGNTLHFQEKIDKMESYINSGKPIRKRKIQRKQSEFDRQSYEAALRYAALVQK